MRFAFIRLLLISLFLWGCITPQGSQSLIKVQISVDNNEMVVDVPAESDVENALHAAGVKLEPLDRVDPPLSTFIENNIQVTVIRIREEFTVEQEVIPFEQQRLQTESLPEQTTLIAQKGENGLREITYQHLFENGVEVSKKQVNQGVIVKEPIPEIIMIGIQTPFAPFTIPGRLAYLLGGNAWIMEGSTAKRQPVVTSGDLDGRIFSLSPDGKWLLFTRRSSEQSEINTLWVTDVTKKPEKLIDLKISNVVHFAGWKPDSSRNDIAFSTVEARSTAPGWQANNDLNIISFSATNWVSKWQTILEANSGGIYGWWGSDFAWSHLGNQIAYFRPDGIGLVDLDSGNLEPLLNVVPYQTHADWAWIPWLSWAPDGNALFTIDHIPSGNTGSPEESQIFDLTALPLIQGAPIYLASQAGMFAYPVTSPSMVDQGIGKEYKIAYLQAIFPTQSETSRYRLWVTDQDGSNKYQLFPAEGESGLDPQVVVWSPSPLPDSSTYAIAVMYQGNIWLVEPGNGPSVQDQIRQVTGDGLVSKISWSVIK
jgi:hypothetical protein